MKISLRGTAHPSADCDHEPSVHLVPGPTPHVHEVARPHRFVDVYSHIGPGKLTLRARRARPLVYVPNSGGDSVDVIDPGTFRVVRRFPVGALPQHITPSYDLRTLYVDDDVGNTLTPIDPRTGRPGRPLEVDDPYNLYFTPKGRYAIVVAERLHRLNPDGLRRARARRQQKRPRPLRREPKRRHHLPALFPAPARRADLADPRRRQP